jgi:protein OS-9
MRLTHLPVMQFVLLVLAVLAVVSWGQFLGHLDVEELEKLHYAIEIDGKPVKINGDGNGATEAGGGGAIVPIVNKFGQRYHCRMPKGIEMEKTDREGTDLESGDEDLAAAGGGVGNGKEKAVLTTKEKIQRMLVPLRTSGCLVRTKDWWTYELCIGRTIKQYHAEGNDKIMPVFRYALRPF